MNGMLKLDSLMENIQVAPSVEISATGSFMFIGELSSATGVDPKTIRYYERERLLSPPRHGRFRVYMKSDVDRLNKVLAMRRMGLSIIHIRNLINSDAESLTEGKITNVLLNHLETLRSRQIEVNRQLKATTDALELCEATGT
jgi:DNA-binding transcriptional MerR regulator